jgi:uncharacterized protein YbjT (DUF2867 family)
MTTILVAAGTGTVGSAIVRALGDQPNVTVRAGFHDMTKAGSVQDIANVEPIAFDFDDVDSMRAALSGVDKVCLISPGAKGYHIEEVKRFVGLAAQAGVGHIVRISIVWASDPAVTFGRWHAEIERSLEDSGVAWTVLRPQPLMDNFIVYTPPDEQGMIYMPVGTGATAYISASDVGLAAAAVLTSGADHDGETHLLSGPAALTTAEVADAIADATRRSINFVDVPADAARDAMQGFGAPAWLIDGQLECYASMKRGETATVTDAVEQLTGAPPRSVTQFAEESRGAWS